jgi:hypothetical protein
MSNRIVKYLLAVALLSWALPAFAQTKPIPYQGSSAAEGSHLFSGTTAIDVSVSWNSATTARYLFVFDSNSTSTHNTTPCSVTQVNGCLLYCSYVSNSGTAPDFNAWDWVMHPFTARNGIVMALSTGAGCGTFTVDGSNDFFYAQVSN